MEVLRRYLSIRDAYPSKALKHTRVLALSGMTLSAFNLFRESLSHQEKNPAPVDMYFYSDSKMNRYVDASMAISLISLSEYTRPSRIVFGDGSMKREGMAAVLQWMVTYPNNEYFHNLEYFQISGHKAAAYEGTAEEALALQNQIVANLRTICTDKFSFPSLRTMNFNDNAYDEFNNGFDSALRSACRKSDTGVTIRANQVTVNYPPMCSTTNADNYWYYDMTDAREVTQCRFTWNWEMNDVTNVYASVGPFPNYDTEYCNPTVVVIPSELAPNPLTVESINITDGLCTSHPGSEFTLKNMTALKSIVIGNECFGSVRSFELDGLNKLESIVIGYESFMISNSKRSDGSFRIVNCPKLQSIQIGDWSFRDYQSFELSNLPSLQSIDIGENCFYYAPVFSLTSLID